MVQRMQGFDDFDGSPATQTIRYGFADDTYEIDLNDEHAQEFEGLVNRYIERSRKVAEVQPQPQPRQRRGRRGGGERRSPEELGAVRQWARAQGFQVSDRGRITADILAKYDAAQGT
jgi:hypothetical protein